MIKYTIVTLILLFIVAFAYFAFTDIPVEQQAVRVPITVQNSAP